MIGFQFYEAHTALNLHFNPAVDYDFFKYNGKTKATRDSFLKNKHRWQYAALEQRVEKRTDNSLLFFYEAYKANDFKYLRPADLFRRSKLDIPTTNAYQDRIVQDLEHMKDLYSDDLHSVVQVGSLYPKIYEAYMVGRVSLETALLVDIHIKTVFNTDLSRDIVSWPLVVNEMDKVRPFIDGLFDGSDFIEKFASHYLL